MEDLRFIVSRLIKSAGMLGLGGVYLFAASNYNALPAARFAALWIAVYFLFRLVFHEGGHFIIGWPFAALVRDRARSSPSRCIVQLGPRTFGKRRYGASKIGVKARIGRVHLWVSPLMFGTAGMCRITDENRFPRLVRYLHVLAGPLCEAIPATFALIYAQSLPAGGIVHFAFTLLALSLQAVSLANLVVLKGSYFDRLALSDGAHIARSLLSLDPNSYGSLPASTLARHKLISVCLIAILMVVECFAFDIIRGADVTSACQVFRLGMINLGFMGAP